MINAIIYQKGEVSNQSGCKDSDVWVLSFVSQNTLYHYSVMGWNGNSDTLGTQVKLRFYSLEHALKYAIKNNISYQIINTPKKRNMKAKSYLENLQ